MNIKFIKKTIANIGLLVTLLLITKVNVNAATYYSIANGPWTTSSTWSLSSSGTAISSGYPGAGDNVIIEGGKTVTIATTGVENLSASNVTIGSSTTGTLSYPTWNATSNLTVSGDLIIGGTSASGTLYYGSWGLTITCNRLLKGIGTAIRVSPLAQDFTFTGIFTLYSGFNEFRNFIIGPLANVTLGGNIETNGSTSPYIDLGGTLNMQNYIMDIGGYKYFYIYGTLILSGNSGGFGSSNFPNNFETLTIGSSSTVLYSFAGNQTIFPTTYANLTISGSGTKTIGSNGYVSSITINNGGSGYSNMGPIQLDFSNGSGSGAQAHPIISSGAITNVVSLQGGNGYTSPFSLIINSFGSGSGADLTANISYINTIIVNGTLSVSECNFSTATGNLSLGSSASAVIYATASLNIAGGTTNFNNRSVTLKSDATGTASIGTIAGTLSNAINITVERYIPANGRRYRFLSSPVVGGTTLQWRDNAGNTSGRGIQITGPTGTVDVSTSNAKSAFNYLETNTTGGINDAAKWTSIDGNTTLTNGKGYRVFVRGDRGISLTTLNADNNATTIWVNGTYPTGTITLPVSYTGNGGQGWNLVGNPYPSAIDWNASSGWTKTNLNDQIAVYRPSTNSYAYYATTGNVSTNDGSNIIGSGQAFWVKATAAPVLTCTEAVKTTAAPPTLLLKTSPSNQLKIKLTQDSSNVDETVIAFGEKYNDGFLENEDVNKLTNATVNVSSVVGFEKYAAINFTSTNYTEKTIPLSVWGNTIGNYELALTQLEGFDAAISLFLKDNYLNTFTAINENKQINFSINSDSLSKGDNRFELLFKNSTTNLDRLLVLNTSVSVYPNPASDLLNINISNAGFKNSSLRIYNIEGQQILSTNMIGANAQLNTESLSNGIYFVIITNENGFFKTVKFIK
jgi:hypothetical protein